MTSVKDSTPASTKDSCYVKLTHMPEKGFNKGSPGCNPGKDATATATHEVS